MKSTNTVSTSANGRNTVSGTTQKLVILALLSAIGFISMMFLKVPVISFLKYEPKDIFITFAGFLYGPLAALSCSVVTGLLELPFSSTGLIGMVMNILSSASFACTASIIYKKRHDIYGASIGLICSVAAMSICMLLWNYLISPLYMGITREEIVPMLSTLFLPFNLLKAGINAAITLLLYRPFLHVLQMTGQVTVHDHLADKKSSVILVAVISAVLLAACIGVVIFLNK
ncbi:MAG: ECF transporter S component [Oscillospiraceae bacterium]|nr:ECF transporter S component [Oscillospiraceae bacterium]